MPLQELAIPVLVVHHEQDRCRLCSYAEIPVLMNRLRGLPKKELLTITGGEDRGDPCEPMAHHGFNGQDAEVVAEIAGWITGNSARSQPSARVNRPGHNAACRQWSDECRTCSSSYTRCRSCIRMSSACVCSAQWSARRWPYEKPKVIAWVRDAFGDGWAAECEVAFGNRPISCFIATDDGQLVGFACYDSTCRDYFGPVGVGADARGRGIGNALLLCCLHAMASLGYAYAIIGGVGDTGFYRKAVGAIEIEGSSPGIYRDRLK
jgi:hypothetical protein